MERVVRVVESGGRYLLVRVELRLPTLDQPRLQVGVEGMGGGRG